MENKNYLQPLDYLPWDEAMNVVNQLYYDKNYRMCVLLGCGFHFGISIDDIIALRWCQLLHEKSIIIKDVNSGKTREVRINKDLQTLIQSCYQALGICDEHEFCFASQDGSIISKEKIAEELQSVNIKYEVGIKEFSSNTIQKTFGRKILENAGTQQDMAIILLSQHFNQRSTETTREFLGY